MLDATEITYEVLVSNEENKIGAYGNSQLRIENSTIDAEIGISESSLGIIKDTIVNIPSISIWAFGGSIIGKYLKNVKLKKFVEFLLALMLILTSIYIIFN